MPMRRLPSTHQQLYLTSPWASAAAHSSEDRNSSKQAAAAVWQAADESQKPDRHRPCRRHPAAPARAQQEANRKHPRALHGHMDSPQLIQRRPGRQAAPQTPAEGPAVNPPAAMPRRCIWQPLRVSLPAMGRSWRSILPSARRPATKLREPEAGRGSDLWGLKTMHQLQMRARLPELLCWEGASLAWLSTIVLKNGFRPVL